MKKFIPELQAEKDDGSPIALPIFLMEKKITEPQLVLAKQEINNIIKAAKKEDKFNLLPYFYPKYTCAKKDSHIHQVPNYAHIAGAAFARVPAVYQNQYAHEYYKALARSIFYNE